MDRKRISDKITILAQLNLDGNCYLIMLMGMLFIFMMVPKASWYHVIVIAIMVVFLSFGAPNQPGSILIGTLIIALFLKADVLIPTAVYLKKERGCYRVFPAGRHSCFLPAFLKGDTGIAYILLYYAEQLKK